MNPDYRTSTRQFNGGSTETFYLPLVGTWFDSDVYWANMDGDVVVDFFPSNSIKQSDTNAGAFAVNCSSMSLVIQTENLTSEDEKNHEVFHSQVIQSNRVLDWVPVREFSKTLTAGSQTTIDLDSVVGKCAGLVVMVRPTGASNTGNGKFDYVGLGPDARFDLVTAGNKSILGSGVPLDASYLKNEVWKSHFSTDYNTLKNAYYIPLTDNTKQAYHGVVNGLVDLNSSGHKLQITPGGAGSDCVQRIVAPNTPVAGRLKFSFKGEESSSLPFNATVPQISAAIDNIETVRNYPGGALSSTSDTTFSANANTNISFAGRRVMETLYVRTEGLVDSGANALSQDTVRDVRWGKDGFTSGTYDVDVYAMVYQTHHSKAGKITTELF
jgi:hypothetical protein